MITFVARFGGVSQAITIPMPAVMAVYARENARGMMLADADDQGHQEPAADPGSEKPDDNGGSGRPRPHLQVVKQRRGEWLRTPRPGRSAGPSQGADGLRFSPDAHPT